jgi:hypothetical protein
MVLKDVKLRLMWDYGYVLEHEKEKLFSDVVNIISQA